MEAQKGVDLMIGRKRGGDIIFFVQLLPEGLARCVPCEYGVHGEHGVYALRKRCNVHMEYTQRDDGVRREPPREFCWKMFYVWPPVHLCKHSILIRIHNPWHRMVR